MVGHIRLSAILQRSRALLATDDQPFLSDISKIARSIRPADWVTYTISAISARPSSFSREMKACKRTLILACGSSIVSFTGMGTRPTNFASSNFSSCRTGIYLNSSLSAKMRKSSIVVIIGCRWWLYVSMELWVM